MKKILKKFHIRFLGEKNYDRDTREQAIGWELWIDGEGGSLLIESFAEKDEAIEALKSINGDGSKSTK